MVLKVRVMVSDWPPRMEPSVLLVETHVAGHGLTGQVNRIIESSGDPLQGGRGVDSLFGEEFTGLVVKALTIDTEHVVVVSGGIAIDIELGGGNLHTHGGASVSSGGQTDTELTAVSVG